MPRSICGDFDDGHTSSNAVMLNALYKLDGMGPNGAFAPYFGGGLGWANVNVATDDFGDFKRDNTLAYRRHGLRRHAELEPQRRETLVLHGQRRGGRGRRPRLRRRVPDLRPACRRDLQLLHVERCSGCGRERVAYNSCRNRHCPKCQGAAAKDWLAAREADLLPVPYFHVVFTLPAEIAAIPYQNKTVIHDLLSGPRPRRF